MGLKPIDDVPMGAIKWSAAKFPPIKKIENPIFGILPFQIIIRTCNILHVIPTFHFCDKNPLQGISLGPLCVLNTNRILWFSSQYPHPFQYNLHGSYMYLTHCHINSGERSVAPLLIYLNQPISEFSVENLIKFLFHLASCTIPQPWLHGFLQNAKWSGWL